MKSFGGSEEAAIRKAAHMGTDSWHELRVLLGQKVSAACSEEVLREDAQQVSPRPYTC